MCLTGSSATGGSASDVVLDGMGNAGVFVGGGFGDSLQLDRVFLMSIDWDSRVQLVGPWTRSLVSPVAVWYLSRLAM